MDALLIGEYHGLATAVYNYNIIIYRIIDHFNAWEDCGMHVIVAGYMYLVFIGRSISINLDTYNFTVFKHCQFFWNELYRLLKNECQFNAACI